MKEASKRISAQDNFYYLLFSLIFLLFSNACVEQFFVNSIFAHSLVTALTVISMSIAVWSLRSSRFIFNTALGLVLATLLITLLVAILDKAELDFIRLLLMLCFFLLTLKLAAQQALFSGKITSNSLVGSICIFLLLGVIWLMLYQLLNELVPNSFSGLTSNDWQSNTSDFIYFSFVTLTTLGFGDLLPLTPLARFLVYMEAVVGVFYMAIVVSSLIGAGINNDQENKA